MAFLIRRWVSQGKRRFQQDGYDLDLSYVTSRVLGMGFPAKGREGLYRNPMPEVVSMLQRYHRDHYKVYNLCSERGYPSDQMLGPVAAYPSDDHQPPPLALIWGFCRDASAWLSTHPDNVVVVHCKAGKGRTGVMICCLLLYLHQHHPNIFTLEGDLSDPVQSVLQLYAARRTHDGNGVTIASQIRFVGFFYKELTGQQALDGRQMLLKEIRINLPAALTRGCMVSVLPRDTDPSTGLCTSGASSDASSSSDQPAEAAEEEQQHQQEQLEGAGGSGAASTTAAEAFGSLSRPSRPLHITIPAAPPLLGIQCITGEAGAKVEDLDKPLVACTRTHSTISFLDRSWHGAAAAAQEAGGQEQGNSDSTAAAAAVRAVFAGDVKVQLCRGSVPLCHLWINTQHLEAGPSMVLHAPDLDKVHPSLPSDVSVEIRYRLLGADGRRLTAASVAAGAGVGARSPRQRSGHLSHQQRGVTTPRSPLRRGSASAGPTRDIHSAPLPSAFQSSSVSSMLANALADGSDGRQLQRHSTSSRWRWRQQQRQQPQVARGSVDLRPLTLPPSSQQLLTVGPSMKPAAYAHMVGPADRPSTGPQPGSSVRDQQQLRQEQQHRQQQRSSFSVPPLQLPRKWPRERRLQELAAHNAAVYAGAASSSSSDSSSSSSLHNISLPSDSDSGELPTLHERSRPLTPAQLRPAVESLTAAIKASAVQQQQQQQQQQRRRRKASAWPSRHMRPSCFSPGDRSDSACSDNGTALLLEAPTDILDNYFDLSESPPKPLVKAQSLPTLRPCLSEGQLPSQHTRSRRDSSYLPPTTNSLSVPGTPSSAVDALSLRWWGIGPLGSPVRPSGATTPTSPASIATVLPSHTTSATCSPGSPMLRGQSTSNSCISISPAAASCLTSPAAATTSCGTPAKAGVTAKGAPRTSSSQLHSAFAAAASAAGLGSPTAASAAGLTGAALLASAVASEQAMLDASDRSLTVPPPATPAPAAPEAPSAASSSSSITLGSSGCSSSSSSWKSYSSAVASSSSGSSPTSGLISWMGAARVARATWLMRERAQQRSKAYARQQESLPLICEAGLSDSPEPQASAASAAVQVPARATSLPATSPQEWTVLKSSWERMWGSDFDD